MNSKCHHPFRRISIIAVAALFVVAGVGQFFSPSPAKADEFDEKIKVLEAEVNGYNDKAKELAEQADSLQTAVAKLENEQAQLQAEIDLNSAKRDGLNAEITKNEQKLKEQGKVLSDTLIKLYLGGKVSSIEIVAGSKSLSDFVDEQTKRDSVRDQISYSTKQIKTLKTQLEKQKAEVEQILKDQTDRRNQLDAKRSEQTNLLTMTQGQEENYKNLMGERNKQIEELRAQQRAANAARAAQYGGGQVVAGDPNKGGYPAYLASAAQDSLVDPWGMYNRECVSYTAWKVQQNYGNMPYWGGRGNANQWPSSARSAGIPTGSTPKVGSVGVMMSGYYGHVVWVEQVNGNQIYVSQYNWSVAGEYSEMWISAAAIDTYIYFGDR
jgi:surface antigen/uncharacterized protein YoxC